jgi:asparagine synthase (glutamine-hydrolysing)
MRDTMLHRGPDGGGTWISPDGKLGLAHRRLSIIDLSDTAAQPMSNADGTVWVTFNGEIYNHADIRKELEKTGKYRWKTDHSDTEVIVHAFEEWGIDCIQRFRGMFAFAIWDARAKELWLVRDRVGIKPLYYSAHHGRIAFASEIKALLADPEQARGVDEEAFFHYLSFITTPSPTTLFAGIRKLPPGTWMRIGADGAMREHRYWEAWDHVKPLTGASEEEVCRLLIDELRTAVRLRKVSDVPVGIFLSGGIDSSTNVTLFSEGDSQRVKAFTIGYAGDMRSYSNETEQAEKMARIAGAEYHQRLLKPEDLISFLPRMIHLQDEPIADPVCVPVYYVSKLARDNGVVVCQLGEGADELFCGYPYWKRMLDLQRVDRLPVPNAAKRLGLLGLTLVGKGERKYYEWLRRSIAGNPIFWGGADEFNQAEKAALLSPRLRRAFAGHTSWEALEPIRRRYEEKAWEKSDLHWMTHLDLNLRLPELLLMRVDKMSMGVSLEGRVPFLDHKFVELALGIPTAMKLKDGKLKYILKKAVRGLIPDEVIDRPKRGFGVPIMDWVYGELGQAMEAELKGFCARTDMLDWATVQRYVAKKEGFHLWYLFNFALWHRTYIEQR